MTLSRDRVRTELAVVLGCEDEAVNEKLLNYVFELHRGIELMKTEQKEMETKLEIAKDILDSI